MTEQVNDGGPAFPRTSLDGPNCNGMSLRDYFAAKAMQGFLSDNEGVATDFMKNWNRAPGPNDLAEMAYGYADAMLAARGAK